jgi:amyloid beta precursor protein binding protein 1
VYVFDRGLLAFHFLILTFFYMWFNLTGPYIALQGCYKKRADEDRAAVRAAVDAILAEQKAKVGGSTAVPDVSDEDVAAFCRNVQNLRKVVTRSYAEEWETHAPSADGEDAPMPTPQEEDIRGDLMMATMDPYEVTEHTPLLWHCALRAADVFCERNGRYPGTPLDADDKALEADAKEVQAILEPICAAMGLDDTDLIKSTLLGGSMAHATEITRYGNAELHNVASVLGGVASQEAVKIITGQYVPLDNTYVYNGIAGTAGVYRL